MHCELARGLIENGRPELRSPNLTPSTIDSPKGSRLPSMLTAAALTPRKLVTSVDQRQRTSQPSPPQTPGPGRRRTLGGRIGSVEVLAALLIALLLFRTPISTALSHPALQTWTTVF